VSALPAAWPTGGCFIERNAKNKASMTSGNNSHGQTAGRRSAAPEEAVEVGSGDMAARAYAPPAGRANRRCN
jgi:hypothetical protein